jgi:hypothetical protein
MKYRLSGGSEHELFAPQDYTIQDVIEIIRVQHGRLGQIKVNTHGADVDQDDSFADWLGTTGGIWDIVTSDLNSPTNDSPDDGQGRDSSTVPTLGSDPLKLDEWITRKNQPK